jgi:peroxidase
MPSQLLTLLVTLLFLPHLASTFKGIPTSEHRYTFDGTGNNEQDPARGSVGTPRVRLVPNGTGFFDALGTPRNEENSGLPSARRLMEDLFRYPVVGPTKQERRCELLLSFGLLVSFDLSGKAANTSEPFDIPCDGNLNDLVFCPATGQTYCSNNEPGSISAFRNQHMLVSGPNNTPYRATINKRTAFLDMEFIYGASKESSDQMRAFEAGQLDLVDRGSGLLPRDPTLRDDLNTAPGGYALIVVFMRFHNYVAKYTMDENPDFTEEEVFQSARNYVIATYQKIIVNNYYPALVGDTLGAYTGYDPNVDPSIDEFFGVVSYRYAHTEQPNLVRLVDEDFVPTSVDPLFLRDVFRQTVSSGGLVEKTIGGIEPIIRGMTTTPLKNFDSYFVDDMNLWTGTTVLDVQRGRDTGIPVYNEIRRLLGLEPIVSIKELVTGKSSGSADDASENSELVQIMQNLYGDDIEKVDAYVGTLFEKPEDSTLGEFGPLRTKSFNDQFNRIRLGDRFWYENVYSEKERSEMLTLTEIIKLVCDGMDKFPWDPFGVWGIDKDDGNEENCDAVQTNQISLLG